MKTMTEWPKTSRLTVIDLSRRVSFVEDDDTGEVYTVWYGSQCSCQESMCVHAELVRVELAGYSHDRY